MTTITPEQIAAALPRMRVAIADVARFEIQLGEYAVEAGLNGASVTLFGDAQNIWAQIQVDAPVFKNATGGRKYDKCTVPMHRFKEAVDAGVAVLKEREARAAAGEVAL